MTRVVVIDIEADNLLDKITKLHCAVAMTLDNKQVWRFEPHQMKEFCEFLDTVDVWVGHNVIQYDIPAVKKVLGYEFKGKRVDTLLMSRLQNPHRTVPFHAKNKKEAMKVHGLYAWGVRVGIDKPEIEYWDEYNPEILHRCEEDVKINVATYHELRKEAEGQNWRNAHLLTFKLWENLAKQEEAGWLIDRQYMEKSIHMLDTWIRRIDAVLVKHLPIVYDIKEAKKDGEYSWVKKPFMKSGKYSASVENHYGDVLGCTGCVMGPFSRISYRPVDLGSPAEAKEWMLSQGWEPEEWNLDDDGNPRSPKMPKDGEFPGVEGKAGRLYAKRAKASHRRSTLVGLLGRVREDGRIAARVSGIADTGRMKHAGVVNIPNAEAFFGPQMRRCFTSAEGRVLVGCDSAGCQNRMLAARVGDDFFTKTLIEGKKENGTSIHHVNQKALKEVAGIEVSYGLAKNLNYAFMFGASDNKLGRMLGKSKEVGSEVRRALLSVAAGFEKLVEDLTAEWRSHAKRRMNKWNKMEYYDGWIAGLDGRPIFIKSEHAILVYMLQSDEAIMMSAAYNLLHQRLSKRFIWGEDYLVVGFMHDEYSVECKPELADEISKIAESCIVDAGKFYKIQCPHKGEASVGKNWYDIH